MTDPVYFVELSSPNHEASAAFFRAVFGWGPQPFSAPEYLVAQHGEAGGVDSAILPSRDGELRTVPVIRVADLDATLAGVEADGGRTVVPAMELGQLGRACYITDPAGLVLGLHFYHEAEQPPRLRGLVEVSAMITANR